MTARRKPKGRRSTRPKTRRAAPTFQHRPLAALKEVAAEAARTSPPAKRPAPEQPPTAPGPGAEDADESTLLAEAMAGVRPLPGRSDRLPPSPALPPAPPPEERDRAEVIRALQELVGGERPFSIFETDEAVEGLAEGVDPRLLRRLKHGEYSLQDHLDLHGYSREQARPIVADFLGRAIADGKRCVLIIHGRGHGSKDKIPVLKLALRSWLERSGFRKSILAFCTARPCDGGAGAVYVLLRKRRG